MFGRNLLGRAVLSGAVVATAVTTIVALAPATAQANSTCVLKAPYKHVIYVQFDNTHLRRDNPNVPSDLEQIPALKNFLQDNGVLSSNEHTILISHTAGGIVSSLTGLYPSDNGITVSNSYVQFNPNGSIGGFPSAFSYWTDPVSLSDSLPNLVTAGGSNTPAPWVPYTRAGCDVGAFSIANMELENTKTTAAGDIGKVFGTGSPEATFANWSNGASSHHDPDSDTTADGGTDHNLAVADFEGIAIHCSQADSGAGGLCSGANGGQPDSLPDEPGGYSGFNGLFGAVSANQVVSSPGSVVHSTQDDDGSASTAGGPGINFPDVAPTVKDVFNYSFNGCKFCNPGASQPIADSTGNSGFPGFSPSAAQTLGYVAAMQEAGIPVTFAYIADVHDDHTGCYGFNAMGPGQSCYEQQLASYNQAFNAFFERLAHDGIDKSNTLFVFTADEGDHYAGGPPTNPGCDGVTTPCQYTAGTVGPNTIGEQDVDLNNALKQETGNTTPFDIHFDDAPTVYVHGQNGTIPSANDGYVRQLERDMGGLTLKNARTGQTDQVMQHIADQTEEGLLHMINADPLRTPTFTLFGNPDYFFETEPSFTCPPASTPGCPTVGPSFAWNHGDDNPEIGNTWLGFVGPTIQPLGQTGSIWTDHTDIRPTMLAALGLKDDYTDDGRVVSEVLDPAALPTGIAGNPSAFERLAAAYKQIEAPFGQLAGYSEVVSTTAVLSQSSGDAVYKGFDQQLANCATTRDALGAQMNSLLQGAEFGSTAVSNKDAGRLVGKADELMSHMQQLSTMTTPPAHDLCASGA